MRGLLFVIRTEVLFSRYVPGAVQLSGTGNRKAYMVIVLKVRDCVVFSEPFLTKCRMIFRVMLFSSSWCNQLVSLHRV